MEDETTIKLKKPTVKILKDLKVHHRQSYDELILKMVEAYKNG